MEHTGDVQRDEVILRAVRARADVADAVVRDLELAGGPTTVVLVRSDDFCAGADVRDDVLDALGGTERAPVVVVAPDAAGFAEASGDLGALRELVDGSPYAYSWVAPESSGEELVAGIVAQVLDRRRVSMTDNFLDLGGDSVLALEVVSELERRTDLALPVEALFETPTVAGFAALTGEGVAHR
jgi:acyl carrier protein